MSMWSRVVAQRRETLCPPNSWPLAEVTHPRWAVALQGLCMDLDVYGAVVSRWIVRVAAHPGYSFALPEYFSYLLNVYDRLAALRKTLGAAAMAEVEASWPNFPRPSFETPDALQKLVTAGDVPWVRY